MNRSKLMVTQMVLIKLSLNRTKQTDTNVRKKFVGKTWGRWGSRRVGYEVRLVNLHPVHVWNCPRTNLM